ncbi:MAG: DGQHR domain-containing protein [Methylobacterium mesophilicum]|nr:DGQHR domain-containing protein [Methylobacterium mesophilicum]
MPARSVEELDTQKLTSTRIERIAEYKKRRRAFDYKRVHSSDVEQARGNGWELDKTLKTGVRMRRVISGDEALENKFWSILYLIGFKRLNVGRHFRLSVKIDGSTATKQIDVLGIDDDTVVVAECKSADSLRKRSLQSALSELDSHKRPIANALRALLGKGSTPKIIWCMVTSQIRWSARDSAWAKEKSIHTIREQELRYFFEIAKTLGAAAKHQFIAEFLGGQKIPSLFNRYVAASKFKLGGRPAYAFTIPAHELLKRAFVNHRDLRDPSGAPSYQRLIDSKRIKAIAEFLRSGGYFANSILVNFHSTLRFDQQGKDEGSDTKFGRLYLPETYKSIWVVDGQHRLYGASLIEEADSPVIPVVAFEKLPPTEEANLFTVINKEQKQVQPRLLDELDGELKWDSSDPEEASKGIAARALDQLRHEVSGPFEDRFAPAGVPASKRQVLTLPQIKQSLVKSGLLGRTTGRDGSFIPGALTGRSNQQTLENTAAFLSSYFGTIAKANIQRWEGGSQNLLCYNTGIQAHIRLCGEISRFLSENHKIDLHELEPEELAQSIVNFSKPLVDFVTTASDEAFKERFFVPFGSGGPARYFYRAAELISSADPTFQPEGLQAFLSGTDKESVEDSNRTVSWISDELHSFVIRTLQRNYGNDFFNLGVKNKEIKKKAYEKSLDDPGGAKNLETYLDIVDLKKIIESSENWTIFKEFLSIPLQDQPKGLAKYILWIDRFNEVRKIWAHPYGRTYSVEDTQFLSFLQNELRTRLS